MGFYRFILMFSREDASNPQLLLVIMKATFRLKVCSPLELPLPFTIHRLEGNKLLLYIDWASYDFDR